MVCQPRGALIDEIHSTWFGNYPLLEQHHGYIQWLFPIREQGVNSHAQPLQLHEARAIAEDVVCLRRVQASYALMLDFYGIRLADGTTGALERSTEYKVHYPLRSSIVLTRFTVVHSHFGLFCFALVSHVLALFKRKLKYTAVCVCVPCVPCVPLLLSFSAAFFSSLFLLFLLFAF